MKHLSILFLILLVSVKAESQQQTSKLSNGNSSQKAGDIGLEDSKATIKNSVKESKKAKETSLVLSDILISRGYESAFTALRFPNDATNMLNQVINESHDLTSFMADKNLFFLLLKIKVMELEVVFPDNTTWFVEIESIPSGTETNKIKVKPTKRARTADGEPIPNNQIEANNRRFTAASGAQSAIIDYLNSLPEVTVFDSNEKKCAFVLSCQSNKDGPSGVMCIKSC